MFTIVQAALNQNTCFADLLRQVKRDTVTVAHGGEQDNSSGKGNVRPLYTVYSPYLHSLAAPCSSGSWTEYLAVLGMEERDQLQFDHVNAY